MAFGDNRKIRSGRRLGQVMMGIALAFAIAVLPTGALASATAPSLGTAESFAVLGGSTVTNTGATKVTGDLGVSPGTAITGFPPGKVTGGSIHSADATALQAQKDVTTAYNNLAGQACDTDLTGQDLGGKTLTSGVYCFTSSAQLTGTLTLDAQGSADAVFIFKIGSTLTTASSSSVQIINGGSNCNVYWQVGSSATLGTGTSFVGNILADASVTLTNGANVFGRVLAQSGAVTMDKNIVSASGCASVSPTPTVTPTATIQATASGTATVTRTPTATIQATVTRTPTTTIQSTASGTATATRTATTTSSPIATVQAVASATAVSVAATPTATGMIAGVGVRSKATAVSGAHVPSSLPRTGDMAPWAGPYALILGVLLLAAGLAIRRARE